MSAAAAAMGREEEKCVNSWDDLPDDCWEAILGGGVEQQQPRRVLRPVSLVSKRFHAMTNHLRAAVTIPSPYSSPFPPSHLYARFPNLKSLHFCHRHPDLDDLIRQLASSSLRLQSFHLSNQPRFPGEAMRLLGRSSIMRRTLRSLSCTNFHCLTDDDLLVVADCFSYLHLLELGHLYRERMITDAGIRAISTKLTSLRSFTVWCDELVSGVSFHYMSSGCPLLSHLRAIFDPHSSVCLHHFSSLASSSLTSLALHGVNISESGLGQLSGANLKLRKLSLSSPRYSDDVGGAALCGFLKSCRSLRHLKWIDFDFPSDNMSDFAASIPYIQVVDFRRCGRLPETILFDLLKRCPDLEELNMDRTFAAGTAQDLVDLPVRCRMRKLALTGWGLSDETLVLISSVCPKLEQCCVAHDNSGITEVGIEAIRASCRSIKRLEVMDCEALECRLFGCEIGMRKRKRQGL